VGGARENPLFARRQIEPRAPGRDDVVDGMQDLARTADRERLDRRYPQLLGRLLRLAGPVLLRGEAAEELVHVAEVAGDEEHEVEAAVIEVREVEARAEHAPPGMARVTDDGAADHTNLDFGVEQREVYGGLGCRQRYAVLGVQMPFVADL